MPKINLDVLAHIISRVEDRKTLFLLLVVSKDVFKLSCRVLYRDPLRYLLEGTRKSLRKDRLAFIRLVLALSPATDNDTRLLRTVFDAPPGQQPVPPSTQPMLDYLALIRVVRWEDAIGPSLASQKKKRLLPGSSHVERERKAFLRSALTWCISGHQLGNIRELEIEPKSLEMFTSMAYQLARVRTIVIHVDRDDDHVVDIYRLAIRLVQEIHKHHGHNLLHECRLSVNPLELHRQSNELYSLAVELSKLLPPISLGGHTWVPHGPLDADLSRLTTLVTAQRPWLSIVRLYQGFSAGQIMQRCRALARVAIELDTDILSNGSLFEWAVVEAHRRTAATAASETLMATAANPAVPVSRNVPIPPSMPLTQLNLRARESPLGGDASINRFKKVLKDALYGFADTLRWVYIDIWVDRGEGGELETAEESQDTGLDGTTSAQSQVVNSTDTGGVAYSEYRTMPDLVHLEYRNIGPTVFDIGVLHSCPNLTSLSVTLSDLDGPTFTSWPVLHSSSLFSLELGRRATHLFDPVSLQHMPRLEELSLVQIEEDPTPGAPRFSNRWTWDWRLPKLRVICLWSATVEDCFSLQILRTCPRVQTIELEASSHVHCRLDVRSVLDNSEQDVFPSLTTLGIWKTWDIDPEDFHHMLMHVFPKLRFLELDSLTSCTGEQILEATRYHPSLRKVDASDDLLDRHSRARLGLIRESEMSPEVLAEMREQCVYDFDGVLFRLAQ
ncbi:hypothetical protein DFQ26_004161 [Actinomortierella ambigua]|nr:hypothetical protein DFQ26_004161 [Actinomortierella ambigua]